MSEILVVIPAYNSAPYIAQCLESVRAQTYPLWDLVVVDDGSSDGTGDIVSGFAETDPRIRLCRQKNAGVAAARNRGLEFLRPDTQYVLLLDNDDYLEADALEVLREALVANPASSAAYGLPRSVGKQGEVLDRAIEDSFGYRRVAVEGKRLKEMADQEPTSFASFVVWDCIATPGQVLMRRSHLDAVGPFDPSTVPSDDWDMWIRLSLHGPFQFLKRFVINKRSHGENVSGKGRVMAVAEPAIRRKLATSGEFTPEQRRVAKAGHLYACRLRLAWAGEELRQRRPAGAMRSVYRFGKSFLRYLQTPYQLG